MWASARPNNLHEWVAQVLQTGGANLKGIKSLADDLRRAGFLIYVNFVYVDNSNVWIEGIPSADVLEVMWEKAADVDGCSITRTGRRLGIW